MRILITIVFIGLLILRILIFYIPEYYLPDIYISEYDGFPYKFMTVRHRLYLYNHKLLNSTCVQLV